MNTMNKKGEITMGDLIILFVAIIVGLALFGGIIDSQSLATDLQPASQITDLQANSCLNQSGSVNLTSTACNITVSNWVDGDWRSNEGACALSSVVVTNGSGTVLVADTDYTSFGSAGTIQMLQTDDTDNATNGNTVAAAYNYCDTGYNKDSGSRGMARLWGLFAAITLAFAGFIVLKKAEFI